MYKWVSFEKKSDCLKTPKAPIFRDFRRVETIGIEPTTFWLPVKRSSQLSYAPLKFFDAAKVDIYFQTTKKK